MSKNLLVALGGNAILKPGQIGTFDEQMENITICSNQIAYLLKQGFKVIITHGNGPQVGNILIQNATAIDKIPMQPLDVCVAKTQGQIGYMLQTNLENVLVESGLSKSVSTILTRVLVDSNDEAFIKPTKPIGPFFTEAYAKERISQGEHWIEDSNRGWRKVVPSPIPKNIIDLAIINHALTMDTIIIAGGGGGIPMVKKNGKLIGVDAVIDKDLVSSKLAIDLKLDCLIMLTGVDAVKINFGKPNEETLKNVSVTTCEKYLNEGHFGVGSMAPKVQAAMDFVKSGGAYAIITSLEKLADAIEGLAGTKITSF